MSDFVHLHLHTEYSLLDGLATIPLAVKRAGELGMSAIAITDHGNMYGAVKLSDAIAEYNKAHKDSETPMKAIIGTEFYVCDDMHVKTKAYSENDESDRRHLILLVKNDIGYKNIAYLNAVAFRDGFYYKPRIDLKTLKEHSEGLICLSACIAGDIPQAILHRNFEKAEELIKWFKGVFGEDFYLEMQNHGLREELEVNSYLKIYSQKFGVKTVVTNDVHYVDKSDYLPHDVLLCVQTKKDFDDPNRMKFSSDDYYLKSYEEMLSLFPDDEQSLKTTLEIAEKCTFKFPPQHYMFPKYVPETGETPIAFIRKLIDDGIKKKYGAETEEIRERIEEELSVIEKQGFTEYFLIVWDYITAARKLGVSVGPGRGSGAGSIVAYLIGITDIDPLKYDLYFERFLNSERVSAPDFDVDFEDCRRQEVIDYVIDKYGADRVCRIITFGTMAAKNAIKDVGRTLGISYSLCDKISKAIPSKQTKLGKNVELKRPNVLQKVFGFYTPNPKEQKEGLTKEHFAVDELVEMYNDNPDVKKIVDIAMRLEDTPRQTSTHACGVIIGHDVLERHMPLSRNGEDITSQYTGVELEHLGFLKMDFLGLRNLSDIKNCIEYVKENHGVDISFADCKYDDPKVYELLSSGNTDAVFQLESAGFQRFLKELKPTCFEDIIAAVSLYRPGPMDSIPTFVENKHNPSKITYMHPLLKPILEQTYGCIVYQEQVMKIVQSLAGYTLGQADMIRRAMGKKKLEEMAKEEPVFIGGKEETVDEHGKVSRAIDGCLKRGVPEDVAKKIWNQMKDFAKYAFNKSHAAAYSVVTYQTAYLKNYYEPEFLTAFLNNRITNIKDIKQYTTYAKEEGIPVLPPDINESKTYFSVKDGSIRFGLAAIKNTGIGIVSEIIEEREKNGKFKDFNDFITRTVKFGLNKRTIESFIFAGAFDCLNVFRSQLIEVYSEIVDRAAESEKRAGSAQISMFDTMLKNDTVFEVKYPEISEFDSKFKLLKEKEVLGIYLSGHPLADFKSVFSKFNFTTKELDEYEEIGSGDEGEEEQELTRVYTSLHEGDRVHFGGIITATDRIMTRSGTYMGFITVEDLYGSIECTLFPKIYAEVKDFAVLDEVVEITGKIHIKDNEVSINTDSVKLLTMHETEKKEEKGEKLAVLISDGVDVDAVRDVLDAYPGDIPVVLAIAGKAYDAKACVRKCEGLKSELESVVGVGKARFYLKNSK